MHFGFGEIHNPNPFKTLESLKSDSFQDPLLIEQDALILSSGRSPPNA